MTLWSKVDLFWVFQDYIQGSGRVLAGARLVSPWRNNKGLFRVAWATLRETNKRRSRAPELATEKSHFCPTGLKDRGREWLSEPRKGWLWSQPPDRS